MGILSGIPQHSIRNKLLARIDSGKRGGQAKAELKTVWIGVRMCSKEEVGLFPITLDGRSSGEFLWVPPHPARQSPQPEHGYKSLFEELLPPRSTSVRSTIAKSKSRSPWASESERAQEAWTTPCRQSRNRRTLNHPANPYTAHRHIPQTANTHSGSFAYVCPK